MHMIIKDIESEDRSLALLLILLAIRLILLRIKRAI